MMSESDLNISHGKMFNIVSFPLLGFTLALKLRNTFIFFDKKMMSDLIISCQTVCDLV